MILLTFVKKAHFIVFAAPKFALFVLQKGPNVTTETFKYLGESFVLSAFLSNFVVERSIDYEKNDCFVSSRGVCDDDGLGTGWTESR